MHPSKPKILVISSANPCKGPGIIAADAYYAFKQQQYDVDFLTLNYCDSHPEFLHVRSKSLTLYNIYLSIRRRLMKWFTPIWAHFHNCLKEPKAGHHFFYKSEKHPPIPSWMVLRQIRKPYDLVYISFWQEMLGFNTVEKIQKKLQCKFIFANVDYSPMTGGCHFTGDCEGYQTGCGSCPAFQSKDRNDFTHHNVLVRKEFYEKYKPIVTGNSYMFSFYDKSYLLRDVRQLLSYPVINIDMFCPYDQQEARAKYSIPSEKSFIILFGSQHIDDERKGIKYLVSAVNHFVDGLSDDERSKVLLFAMGNHFEQIKPLLHADSLCLGYLKMEQLPEVYSLADLFLCSSVNDAGPMMVNQALCCGTPVVGFEMGACVDSVKDKGTGYCAQLRDSIDMANGIRSIYNQSENERVAMRKRCRAFAEQAYSYQATVDRVVNAYQNM